jgi:hypothetical protein
MITQDEIDAYFKFKNGEPGEEEFEEIRNELFPSLQEVYCQECNFNLTGQIIYLGNDGKAYCGDKRGEEYCFELASRRTNNHGFIATCIYPEDIQKAIRDRTLIHYGSLEKAASK